MTKVSTFITHYAIFFKICIKETVTVEVFSHSFWLLSTFSQTSNVLDLVISALQKPCDFSQDVCQSLSETIQSMQHSTFSVFFHDSSDLVSVSLKHFVTFFSNFPQLLWFFQLTFSSVSELYKVFEHFVSFSTYFPQLIFPRWFNVAGVFYSLNLGLLDWN